MILQACGSSTELFHRQSGGSPSIGEVHLSFFMAGVVDEFFREALGGDVVKHAICGRVEMTARILHVVLENYLT